MVRHVPVEVALPSGRGTVSNIVLGSRHFAAICPDGWLWMWALTCDGQFGDGTTTHHRSVLVKVALPSGCSMISNITFGDFMAGAICSNGSLWM